MKSKNFLSNLWSLLVGSQRNDVEFDRRLTVGSPSGFTINWTLKLVSVLVLVLTIGSGNVWGQSTTYTSNVTFTAGTNGSTCKVIVTGSTQYDGMKLGTSSKTGTMTFTVPAGTTTIHIHAAGWNSDGGSRTLNISTSRGTLASGSTSMALTNDAGVSSSSPFTLSTPANASTSYYKSLSISGVTGGTATITITTSSKRAVVWGVNAVVPASCTTNPTVTAGSNSSVTATTATVSCSSGISSLGSAGCSISSYGFVLNTTGTPTISDTKHQVGTTYTTTGTSFSKDLTGLSAETTYYVRPYATNGNGTAYGTQTSFTTSALPKYTISFETGTGNPTQADITETVAGAGITLPAGPTPTCSSDGWSFAGWGYESCDETTDEPYLYFSGNIYYPADDETLYAVYVQDKTPTTTYMLLSEGAQVAPDANYIITATAVDKAIKSEVYSSYYIEATDVTVTEDENGYYIANPNSELIWNMGKTGSTISLYNASDKNYLKIYETSGHHNLALDASKHTFTLSEVRDPGNASTFKMESTKDPGYYVLYSTSNIDFTATSNDNLEDTELYLYKQMNSGTYNSNPTCCDKEVTLAHNSPSNGTVSFAPAGPIETCDGTVNTTMTITPAAGYTLTAFNYSTGAGTVSPTNQSPGAPNVTTNSATPQVITLTFAQDANGTCTANATFSVIAPTAWSWTYNSAAIPNPINLYIGQTAALVATYTPSGLLNSEKDYNITKSSGLTQVSKTYAVEHPTYTFRADEAMDDGTVTLTNKVNSSLTITVHVHVSPLPLVHFVDIVHGYVFADVVGTIEDNALVANKTTPTHEEYSGTGANDCETEHTRLVGWIEKTWADTHPNATHADIIDAGTGVFIEASAAINVLTYNGKTYS